MQGSATRRHFVASSAELQDYLLNLSPETLIIVPHSRLAHQVWRRQRLAARDAGRVVWQPLPMLTLADWWGCLLEQLWLSQPVAQPLQRLALWQQALEAVPPPEGLDPDLNWAAAFEETHSLLQRYRLTPPAVADSLVSWREEVRRGYRQLLAEAGLLDPTDIPDLLLAALAAGQLLLPAEIYVVGLETPAVVEQEWLAAVARQRPVTVLEVCGGSRTSIMAVELPDRQQEIAWVLTQAAELVYREGLPWHRLAITAPVLEDYLPGIQRHCQELFGEADNPAGGFYNLSLGPRLVETPLYQAALLPLKFLAGGEKRADLYSWLLSPYYGAFAGQDPLFCTWDRRWREEGIDDGWRRLVQVLPAAAAGSWGGEALDRLLGLLPADRAPAARWWEGLISLWRYLGFPGGCSPEELEQWQRIQALLGDLDQALGSRPVTAAQYYDWLNWGAKNVDLPGPGSTEAGLQIQGLLEMRGLDFAVVFCLGLNQGQLPQPPRQLPLLTPEERRRVLGGSYESQLEFAEIAFRYLQAAAPRLVCTRPRYLEEEEQTPCYLVRQPWQESQFALLARPHPFWLRVPAVRAVWQPPPPPPALTCYLVSVPRKPELSLTAISQALACPCRFFLAEILALAELPEVEGGLAPLARGALIHQVLEEFLRRLAPQLTACGDWDQELVWQTLQAVLAGYQHLWEQDPHWEAELGRWLDEELGLLRAWLREEERRFREGWRWLLLEESFAGLQLDGIPFRLKGRLDRVDWHPELGLMIWDYKTGSLPSSRDIHCEPRIFQLVGGIWAVVRGLVTLAPAYRGAAVRAGFISLKSSRQDQLKFEDYRLSAADWEQIAAARQTELAQLAQRWLQGHFPPEPQPAPTDRQPGACEYCPFPLLCNFIPATPGEEHEPTG